MVDMTSKAVLFIKLLTSETTQKKNSTDRILFKKKKMNDIKGWLRLFADYIDCWEKV